MQRWALPLECSEQQGDMSKKTTLRSDLRVTSMEVLLTSVDFMMILSGKKICRVQPKNKHIQQLLLKLKKPYVQFVTQFLLNCSQVLVC